MKPFFFTSFLLLAATTTSAQNRPFIISGVPFYPFHYVEDEKAKGIFVTFVDQIFSEMNTPYIVEITDATGFDRVKKGEIDAVMSVGYAKDRESFLIYPDGFQDAERPANYVWISSYHFFVQKKQQPRFSHHSLQALKAKNPTIGVIKGISYHPDFWAQTFTTRDFTSNEEGFKALNAGDIDLFFIDKTVGSSVVKRDGLGASITSYTNPVFQRYYTLVLSKASTYPEKDVVLRRFFEGYEKLKAKGEARKIFARYMN